MAGFILLGIFVFLAAIIYAAVGRCLTPKHCCLKLDYFKEDHLQEMVLHYVCIHLLTFFAVWCDP